MGDSQEAWELMCKDLEDYKRIKLALRQLIAKYAEMAQQVESVDVSEILMDISEV